MSYHDYAVLCTSINTAERNHPFALTITMVVAAVLTCNQVMWVTNLFRMYSVIIFWTFSSWKSRAEKHCLKRNEEHCIKTNGKLTKTQRHACYFFCTNKMSGRLTRIGRNLPHTTGSFGRFSIDADWMEWAGQLTKSTRDRRFSTAISERQCRTPQMQDWKSQAQLCKAHSEPRTSRMPMDLSSHQTVSGVFIQLSLNRLQRRSISRFKKHFDEICKKESPRVSVKRFL